MLGIDTALLSTQIAHLVIDSCRLSRSIEMLLIFCFKF